MIIQKKYIYLEKKTKSKEKKREIKVILGYLFIKFAWIVNDFLKKLFYLK